MEQRQLVAIVITSDGKRVPVRLSDDNRALSLLERLQQRVRRFFGR
ncbi:MAG TPA: hypothetical protein VK992_06500 [Candidatus Caenarcaniphilales bacterium]|nr:hypothetical protein [Candidatus Caenarcaniphilales bacterium]